MTPATEGLTEVGVRPVSWQDFYRQSRGIAPLTLYISSVAGALIASMAYRRRWAPSVLTLAGLVLGVSAGAALTVARNGPPLIVVVAAVLALHLAYAFDCADGQLARVTGATSAHGARLDVLCDFLIQSLLLVGVGSVLDSSDAPVPLTLAFVTTWSLSLFLSTLTGPGDRQRHSLVRSDGRAAQILRLLRDYPVLISVLGLALCRPDVLLVPVAATIGVINFAILLLSIAREAWLSPRTGEDQAS